MTNLDRRKMLIGSIASLGLASLSSKISKLFAQSAAPGNARRIDVHHHFAAPEWLAEVKGRPLLLAPNTTWTPAKSIEDMDKGGVATAVVSVTNPGLWFGDKTITNRLARQCNEFGAK